MREKFHNDAIIGNKNIVASFSKKGELLRFSFPYADGRQFIDHFYTGIKVNDSDLIYLHKDINNKYAQKYIERTNILETNIVNTYFGINIKQIDFVVITKDILVKKYIVKNENTIDLDVKFVINNNILGDNLENYGSRIFEDGIVEYNHNYEFSIYSDQKIDSYKLSNVKEVIDSGEFYDDSYTNQFDDVAIAYNLGTIKPGESKEFVIFVTVKRIENLPDDIHEKINVKQELERTKRYWNKYVNEHYKLRLSKALDKKRKEIDEIYVRSILLFPLLINDDTGGVIAAQEADEDRKYCDLYTYCWNRDMLFIAKAFDQINMLKETEKFYNNFCHKTQLKNGMWEQRYFSDGHLAPCWGYQIDETASIICGIYDHYNLSKNNKFLEQNLKMCEKGIEFLEKYTMNILNTTDKDLVKRSLAGKYLDKNDISKTPSFDLWEEKRGIHLYSLASIIAAFENMKKIYRALSYKNDSFRLRKEKRNNNIKKLDEYINLLTEFINNNLIDNKKSILKRNTEDNLMDVSMLGVVYPFNILNANDKVVKNTVEKINMTIRTYTGGYLRYEKDKYIGGRNPWIITTLWMALYYLEIDDIKHAEECFDFVLNKRLSYGFLSEQVSNDDKDFKWIVGLGWSHAMFIIVLNELNKKKQRSKQIKEG